MSKRIAIIGSGMAGLAAGWYLGREHHVTLFERQSRIGIGAHSLTLEGGCVDVPLRVLYPGYYPQLFSVLADSGVEVEALDAALSFSELDGSSYFRYHNAHIGSRTVPLVSPRLLLSQRPRHILGDLGRFMFRVPRDHAAGRLEGLAIGDYLKAQGYSSCFVDKFLIPCFAGINTVSNADVGRYPADLIAQYFTRGFIFSKVFRAVGGAAAIATALSARIADVRLAACLASIRREADGVRISHNDGRTEHFDAVVFATQANQVLPLLHDASAEEREVLGSFRYNTVRVLMHQDPALAPRHRRDWAPVNYLLSDQADRPMVTIWVNRLLPAYSSPVPTFQTINPNVEVDASRVLAQADLQRPIVDIGTGVFIERLQALNGEQGRRVFFCGSYAASGIPLLESATVSAQRLASLLTDQCSSRTGQSQQCAQ